MIAVAKHCRVIAKTNQWHHVGNGIGRQHEIGDRTEKHHFHMPRGVVIEGTAISREEILGKGNMRSNMRKLTPKVAKQRIFVLGTPPECGVRTPS